MKNIYLYLGLFLLVASCSLESKTLTNLQQSERFLLENATKGDVVSIEEGLQYYVMQSGDADSLPPVLSEIITAHFHGTLMDETVFWSSAMLALQLLTPVCFRRGVSMIANCNAVDSANFSNMLLVADADVFACCAKSIF